MNDIIQTKLGQIEYSSIGQGTPIVFFHGGHSNCQETLFYKGYDTARFQLITPSRPGYGQTPLNGHKQPKEAASLIAAMLEKLDLHQVVVVGISAGGLTAIEFA
ncbi:MAG TPA: alpha/beta hydrolase, partial [Microscillaceae bacterium]|nr:alpha/beta hydrolase [Microscillaceae bacterium]